MVCQLVWLKCSNGVILGSENVSGGTGLIDRDLRKIEIQMVLVIHIVSYFTVVKAIYLIHLKHSLNNIVSGDAAAYVTVNKRRVI